MSRRQIEALRRRMRVQEEEAAHKLAADMEARMARRQVDDISRDDGLTNAEGAAMDALCDAANAFGQLPSQHPDEKQDFCDAIHRAQDLLAVRIARRHYPKGWPDKSAVGSQPARPSQMVESP